MLKKILFLLMFCILSGTGFAQKVAVKTNALYWMAATPNLGVEVALSPKSTISTTANYNPWTLGDNGKLQHWFVRPEYRYWFSEKYSHFFVSAHLIGGGFEVGGFYKPFHIGRLANNYYKGSFFGAGLGLGYSFYISPRWNIETSVGAGLLRFEYRTKNVNHSESQDNQVPHHYKRRILPFPTEASVSFVYFFNSRK